MKKSVKIVSILMIALVLMLGMTTFVNAKSAAEMAGELGGKPIEGSTVTNVGQNIINIITTAAIVIAVIVLLILGIKYMIGSASEKAEYKKTMIPYLVGAVLVFGAAAIAKAVIGLASNITA